ncbi:MAG TPA: FAD-dependent oxidoreductase [Actinomycetales bacterium]|nr:FAD-dependent oxidoreductase [Actinomycetales bacterium]
MTSSQPPERIVIVGASLAGATAAQTLRDEGYEGAVVLVGEEPSRPYERPPLSKGYLLGNDERESIFVHPEDWYAEHDVDLRLGTTVTAVDAGAHEVRLSDGGTLPYDRLLLTTGSAPRRLDVPGGDLDGVLYLRRVEDTDALREAFARKPRVVVIGAGWIGLETAAAARQSDLDVTVVEMAELPLLRVLGPEVAQVFADLHREHGVDFRFQTGVEALLGEGTVSGVRLSDGTEVPADLVLVGVGISPRTELAKDAGLDVSNGVDTDEHLRTSDADVFAAGDVANAWHPVLKQRIRVEHWENARQEGKVAAEAMLGRDSAHVRLPYFFTDQYDLGMEYTGYVDPTPGSALSYDEVVFRGDKTKREFIVFWLREGRVLAGMNVNVWDVVDDVAALITSGRTVDRARLADPEVPLDQL